MKTIITSAIIMATGVAFAQNNTNTIYLANQSKTEVVRNLASSQYGNGTEVAGQVGAQIGFIHGADKWLKSKEEGNRYSTFEVYDINGKDKEDVVMGLITGDLDRETRYNKLGEEPEALTVAQTDVEVLQTPASNITSNMKENVAGFRFKDKYFVILGADDYRYVDGKAIVGDKPVVSELKKGKPITAITFFYELQKAGIADKNMTVTEFLNLTSSEQQDIVNSGTMAGN